jgi:hypothetical protein
MQVGDRRWVTEGWAGKGICLGLEMMEGAIAWMEMPEHCTKNPTGWLSQYRGDEYPPEDWYLVSTMHEHPNENIPYLVRKLRFNANKEIFGGTEYIAWMPLPQPFTGVK